MKNLDANIAKAIELFSDKWGFYACDGVKITGFVYRKPTEEEVRKALEMAFHWWNAPNFFKAAQSIFACYVRAEDYPDFRRGYYSGLFLKDLKEVLNAAPLNEAQRRAV